MIVRSTLTIVSLLAVSLFLESRRVAAEQDYAVRYKQLQDQKAEPQIEPLLDEWRAQKPNDPEAWITSANYYFNKSVGPMLSTKRPEKGDFALKKAKSGKAAGSISFKPIGETADKATELLQEATKKFPDRLDIWCGLAFIFQERGSFDSEFATLKNMVTYSRGHAAELQWLKGEPLKEPAGKFIPEKLHSYGLYYQKKDTPEGGKRFLQIATFSSEQFPDHPYAFNDVGGYYGATGDLKKAREWFEKAIKVDPQDDVALVNLGAVCAKLGDAAAAQKWYEEAINVNPNGEYAQEATDALRKLGKK